MVGPIFSSDAHAAFDAAYPGAPTHLTHQIADHPLLELGALLQLAGRLRPESLEHNAAVDLPLGIRNADIPANGLSVADTIARIDECGSWVLLKTVDQDAAYAALMREVLAELAPVVEPRTGRSEEHKSELKSLMRNSY